MIQLVHTGSQIITSPDITIGRRNADFGQGFYLSDNVEFSKRWARSRKGETTYLNTYELDTDGLNIKRFGRDTEWFEYIYSNRSGRDDTLAGFDVISGPIANDTIYDTWGIITSGLLKKEQALRLLMIGPVYEQTVIKTEKAVNALRFIRAEEISPEEIASYRGTVRQEEEIFQQQFAALLAEMTGSSDQNI
ncbi:MAG: DUF3990 domain-containing protein [Lachnospiraceae bacterium]|nr:DUF3990 domain-containing protein [Lachnospiraceae bacterium]